MKTAQPSGLLVIDKPTGITSRDAVNRVQKWFPRGTRIGHAGTLDPLATGVLVVAVGPATRLIEYVQRMDKEYVTDLVLGAVSDTDDADGTVTPVAGATPVSRAAVEQVLQHFLGMIEQVPPRFSAAHVEGRRAYDLARDKKDVPLAPRPVRIDAIDLLEYRYPDLQLRIRCGKGTYVRSVARDLGQKLGCGAYVRLLRRERIGPFTPGRATLLTREPIAAPMNLIPLEEAVVTLPTVHLSADQFRRLAQGQSLSLSDSQFAAQEGKSETAVFVDGQFAAIGTWDAATAVLAPAKVLPKD